MIESLSFVCFFSLFLCAIYAKSLCLCVYFWLWVCDAKVVFLQILQIVDNVSTVVNVAVTQWQSVLLNLHGGVWHGRRWCVTWTTVLEWICSLQRHQWRPGPDFITSKVSLSLCPGFQWRLCSTAAVSRWLMNPLPISPTLFPSWSTFSIIDSKVAGLIWAQC